MNGIIQILEMKNIELERTLLVEKIGISFRNSNADVCNRLGATFQNY
ncbi:hypothetical protein AC094_01300 [Bacteroides fragilis]|uniref:Uncharacterized protein n=2 Tax=Bacteroides fragilis TaxID=817 RepID=A0A853Q6E8_BACFG|nr:hypothetical protein M075_4796 [Bacteroides fragilis str. 20793-3]OCR36411.1 hypothetical protein AC094_01300 [Bacteroides fragilis]